PRSVTFLDTQMPDLDRAKLRPDRERALVTLGRRRPAHLAVHPELDLPALERDLDRVPLALLHVLHVLVGQIELLAAEEQVVVALGVREELEADRDVAGEGLRRLDADVALHLRVDDHLAVLGPEPPAERLGLAVERLARLVFRADGLPAGEVLAVEDQLEA